MPVSEKKRNKTQIKNSVAGSQKISSKYGLIATVLFFIFIALFSSFKITGDDDVFWHLKTGEYIVENSTVPSSDVFGFVTEGEKWIPFEWGWDVLLYGIYKIGGYELITLFRSALVVGIFAMLFLTARKFKVETSIILLLLFISSFSIISRLNPRPQIISYLFLSILMWLLLSSRTENFNKKYYYFLPVIFLLWGNMHLGVILGVAVLSFFVVSAYLTGNTRNRNPVIDKSFILIYILSLLALLVNPHFIDTYIYAYGHTKMSMLEFINEWKSPFSGNNPSYLNIRIFFGMVILGLILAYSSFKAKDYFLLFVFTFTLYLALDSMRFITDFLILNFAYYTVSLNKLNSELIQKFFKTKLLYIGLIILFAIASFTTTDNTIHENISGTKFREFGIGINENFYPTELLEFAEKNNIHKKGSKPFNKLSSGGLLIWKLEGVKNFIDSRNLSDHIYFEYKSIDQMNPGFDRKLEDYGIDYIIYNVPYMKFSAHEMRQTLLWYLMSNSEIWKLVYWDDKSFLFVKNIHDFKEIIENNEYKFITPFNLVYRPDFLRETGNSINLQPARTEFKRKISEEPNGFFINEIKKHFPKLSY